MRNRKKHDNKNTKSIPKSHTHTHRASTKRSVENEYIYFIFAMHTLVHDDDDRLNTFFQFVRRSQCNGFRFLILYLLVGWFVCLLFCDTNVSTLFESIWCKRNGCYLQHSSWCTNHLYALFYNHIVTHVPCILLRYTKPICIFPYMDIFVDAKTIIYQNNYPKQKLFSD